MANKIYRADYECNVAGTFTNENSRDIPDKNLIDNLSIQFPELPPWMLNAAVLYHNKNPYASQGIMGKKPPTGKEKRVKARKAKEEFTVAPEWFGETPEERKENGGMCRSQEEALLYISRGENKQIENDNVVKPLPNTEVIENIVSKL